MPRRDHGQHQPDSQVGSQDWSQQQGGEQRAQQHQGLMIAARLSDAPTAAIAAARTNRTSPNSIPVKR